jgi:hypothetical protein
MYPGAQLRRSREEPKTRANCGHEAVPHGDHTDYPVKVTSTMRTVIIATIMVWWKKLWLRGKIFASSAARPTQTLADSVVLNVAR